MVDQKSIAFSSEEKDILQEIMNIAFGNATADLSNLIDIQIILSIPDVRVLHYEALPDYLMETINHGQRNSVTCQKFWGDFSGSGVLFLPSGTEKILDAFLTSHDESDNNSKKTDKPISPSLW